MGYNVGRTIIKQPYLDGLYHLYIYTVYIYIYDMVKLGMVY